MERLGSDLLTLQTSLIALSDLDYLAAVSLAQYCLNLQTCTYPVALNGDEIEDRTWFLNA